MTSNVGTITAILATATVTMWALNHKHSKPVPNGPHLRYGGFPGGPLAANSPMVVPLFNSACRHMGQMTMYSASARR